MFTEILIAALVGLGGVALAAALGYLRHRAPAGPLTASDQPAPPGGFRRADFEAKAAEYERGLGRKVYWMVVAPVFVGIPALIAIDVIARKPDQSPSFAGLFILLGIIGVSAAAYLAMATRLARRLGLVCAACHLAFATSRRNHHLINLVLETGKCPGCGKQLLNEVDVGRRLTRA